MAVVIDDQQHPEKFDTPAVISASARIEYILRFNQQVVLVVDDQQQGYLNAGSEFLDTLPENHNAAYLSISNKFNDIQVRCRIIEQLFGDMPFDPETPLASCIINLLKDSNDHICIVLENAEHLSLQILHELCQLSEIAKKSDRIINVVLLGSIAAGKTVINNPVLFKQKVAIISGHNGQILSSTDTIFADPHRFFELTLAKKLLMLVLVLSLIASVVVYQLYQRDNFQFSALPEKSAEQVIVTQEALDDTEEKTVEEVTTAESDVITADSEEIYSALLMQLETKNENRNLNAIESESRVDSPSLMEAESTIKTSNESSTVNSEKIINDEVITTINDDIDIDYFKSIQSGDVIQFAAFPIGVQRTNINSYKTFKARYPQLHFNAYFRLINKQAYIVITSDVFSSKNEAKQKLVEIPNDLKEKGAWIKSLTAVKNEIQTFERESLNNNQ